LETRLIVNAEIWINIIKDQEQLTSIFCSNEKCSSMEL